MPSLCVVSQIPTVMANFYFLTGPKSPGPRSPWGDYSSILIRGMAAHLPRKDGLIQLERTGPYIPPISFPGLTIVVTNGFRQALESSGLAGAKFQPVIKKHIVHLDWQTWDLSAKKPAEYPEGGAPAGYILDRPHSPETSAEMGDLWELLADQGATSQETEEGFALIETSWRGTDFFRLDNRRVMCITEKAKRWLEEHVAEHVHISELPVG